MYLYGYMYIYIYIIYNIYIYLYICIYSRIKQFSKLHVSIKHINSVKSVKENKHSCVNFSSIAALEKQK